MIGKISHAMLWASDLAKVSQWYKEKLGFEVSYHAPGEFLSMHHIEMGRLDFHDSAGDTANIGKGPIPYYMVKDIEAVRDFLISKSIKVDGIQQEGDSPKHTWFWDCEGNVISLEEV